MDDGNKSYVPAPSDGEDGEDDDDGSYVSSEGEKEFNILKVGETEEDAKSRERKAVTGRYTSAMSAVTYRSKMSRKSVLPVKEYTRESFDIV